MVGSRRGTLSEPGRVKEQPMKDCLEYDIDVESLALQEQEVEL